MGYRDKRDPRIVTYQNKYYQENKEKVLARQRERKHEIKDKTLQKLYNITLEYWKQLFEDQGGCCAICGIPQSKLKRELDTDHCHTTGKVRGLLCGKCNTDLGMYEKKKDLFEKYLMENSNDSRC